MRSQEVVSVSERNINSGISKVKQYQETMTIEQSRKEKGEYEMMKSRMQKGGYSKCANIRSSGRGSKIGHKIRTYILPGNIVCTFKNKVPFIKLE